MSDIPTIIVGSAIKGVRVATKGRAVADRTEVDLSPAQAVEFALRLINAANHAGDVKVTNRKATAS